MAVVENAEFWREFIAMYKELPELWQVKNDKFKNKPLKEKSCQLLLNKLKEIQPFATDSTLKRKLSILKDSYRRELSRVRRSELNARNQDDFYKPKLQFFNELSFLGEQDLNVVDGLTETETEEEEKPVNDLSTYEHENEQENEIQKGSLTPPKGTAIKKTKNERVATPYNPKTDRTFMDSMNERNKILFKQVLNAKQLTSSLDDANVFSATWAALFRKLDPDQQMFANKAIMDVLYQGQLCRLDENSVTKLEEGSGISLHSSTQDLKIRDYTWKN